MDDRRFDALVRSVAGAPSRRGLIRALARAAAGGLLAVVGRGEEAAAGGCKNDGDCRPCQRCDRKRGEKRGRCRTACRGGEVCCAGRCGKPGPECCTSRADCGAEGGCMRCQIETGRCEPEPDGRECADCKRCKGGACTEADPNLLCDGVCCGEDELCTDDGCCPVKRVSGRRCCAEEELCGDRCCPEEHACRNGRCCRVCGDACCGAGKVCIDGGVFGDTFCCDAATNTPCGDNGDGTYDACCSDANEECCDGACVPKGECCRDGQRNVAGACCPDGRPPCDGFCCYENTVCCHGDCIHKDSLCCDQGKEWCSGSHGRQWCCPDGYHCSGGDWEDEPTVCCPSTHSYFGRHHQTHEWVCCDGILQRNCVGPTTP